MQDGTQYCINVSKPFSSCISEYSMTSISSSAHSLCKRIKVLNGSLLLMELWRKGKEPFEFSFPRV